MTVGEFIDDLLSAANRDDEIRFSVSGTIHHHEYVSGEYYGDYGFDVDVCEFAEVNDVSAGIDGKALEVLLTI